VRHVHLHPGVLSVIRRQSCSLLLLGLIGCAPLPPGTPLPLAESSPLVRVVASPAVDSVLAAVRSEHPVPALAAAAVQGDTIFIGTVGERRLLSGQTVRHDDRFHVGSLAKSMTATLIGALVDEGILAWTTTPPDLWPEWSCTMHPSLRPIRLEQLLSHTAGLSSFNPGDPELDARPELSGTPAQQRATFARWLLGRAPAVEPGIRFLYSNAGYALAAAMAERATGRPWDALMREYVFMRLGLRSAGFGWPAATDADQPWGHEEEEGESQPQDPDGMYQLPAFLAPAGDVHMSVEDLARYAQAHLRGLQGRDTRLRLETFRKLHTGMSARTDHPSFEGAAYALGWNVRPAGAAPGAGVSDHTGGAGTFIAAVRIDPQQNLATVVMTNAGGASAARAVSRTRAGLEARFRISASNKPDDE
jgi:CubicO group peptidase (beta-lactamase class C family)